MTTQHAFASLPHSKTPWVLQGVVGDLDVQVSFTVPASYVWSEHVEAAKFQDPCTKAVTIMVVSDGTPGKLSGRPTMHCYGIDAKAAKDALRAAWAAIGPWELITPTETLQVVADPSAEDYEATNLGGEWQVAFSLQEI